MSDSTEPIVDEPAARGRVSAACVRREIVGVLAGTDAMTPARVREAVARALPATERPSIAAQLQVLRDGGYVTASERDSRLVTLTESGRLWAAAIAALPAGAGG